MTARAKAVLEKALQLSERERARLAGELLASLDGEPDPDAEAAWAVELERRARRALTGTSSGRDWVTIREGLRKSSKRR